MKIIINKCWGGFSISLAAAKHMANAGSERARKIVAEHEEELKAFRAYRDKGIQPENKYRVFRTSVWDIAINYGKRPDFHGYGYCNGIEGGFERDDPLLVAAVEQLGSKANGTHASLEVVEIPDGIKWNIHNYDGIEHVEEEHRTWG